MICLTRAAAIALCCTAAATGLQAQSLTLHRVSTPIRLDGILDEAAWLTLDVLPLTMFRPTAGATPTESAEVRIGYDDHDVYIGARLGMRNARAIRSQTLTRDGLGVDDWFRVLLDPYHDRQSGVEFRTNPAGAQYDAAVSADGAVVNESWNSVWSVATARSASGWTLEMRIPLSSLRFQVVNNQVTMGLLITRFITESNEWSTFPAVDPHFPNADAQPSLAQAVILEGVRPTRPAYLTPYLLAGVASTNDPSADGSSIVHSRSTTRELGGDLKVALTSNLNLDLTANTDFAQVESDDQQVNLTRFDLSFEEKRQFFQEGAGIFAVDLSGLGGPETMFYSRRIGLADDGRPLRIYGGARLVGRVGGWDVGALDMQAAIPDGSESENLGVWRVRRQIFNDQSTVGAIATTRLGVPGQHNTAYAIDGHVRVLPRDYALFNVGQSADDRLPSHGWDSRLMQVGIERPPSLESEGFTYRAGVQWAGKEFAPGLGFFPRNDYTLWYGEAHYGINPGPKSIFQIIQPNLTSFRYAGNADGTTESSYNAGYVAATLRSGSSGYVGLIRNVELLPDGLFLPDDATVPAGSYRFSAFNAGFSTDSRHAFRLSTSLTVGKLYDGQQFDLFLRPTWTISPRLEASASLERNRIRFGSRNQVLNADLAQFRLQAAFTTRFSVAAFVQYNRAARLVAGNLRARYRFAEGRDLYVIANNATNSDRDRFLPLGPRLPVEQNQALLVKYSHMLVW
ncbi:MAG: DUF5916 domain-containing protein [Gemmatimonadota bacterium]